MLLPEFRKKLLQLFDGKLPISHKLQKLYDRNYVKIRYIPLPNQHIISTLHSNKISNGNVGKSISPNDEHKITSLTDVKFLESGVVYGCKVHQHILQKTNHTISIH